MMQQPGGIPPGLAQMLAGAQGTMDPQNQLGLEAILMALLGQRQGLNQTQPTAMLRPLQQPPQVR